MPSNKKSTQGKAQITQTAKKSGTLQKSDLPRVSFRKKDLLERARSVQNILDELIPSPEIPLQHTSPFTLLIAVLLSAQCTDERVNMVTPQLFNKASTPLGMMAIPVEEIEEIIRPCGLYRAKAKNIIQLSRILVEKSGGAVPHSLEELETLPGVGHKTASVVMVQAFHTPAFPVDTHIFRSARRWGLSKGKNVEEVERDLKLLFEEQTWGKLHLQIILYARKFCPARGHIASECPMCYAIHEESQS